MFLLLRNPMLVAGDFLCYSNCGKKRERIPDQEVFMGIRRAQEKDAEDILRLLVQVNMVHHIGRPDLFKGPTTKYTKEELLELLHDDSRPVFVLTDETDSHVLGHAFCIFQQVKESNLMTDIKTLYIDDICVDENCRGRHVGKQLYEYVRNYAKENGCYNMTLNVWRWNEGALKFYAHCGVRTH